MRAQDVLQAQLRFKSALDSSQVQFWAGEHISQFTREIDSVLGRRNLQDIEIDGYKWTRQAIRWVERAMAFCVSKDMIPVVEYAAGSLESDEKFKEETFPCHTGFLEFEEPINLPDFVGDIYPIKYLLWDWKPVSVYDEGGWWVSFFDQSFRLCRLDLLSTKVRIGPDRNLRTKEYKLYESELDELRAELSRLEEVKEQLYAENPDRVEELDGIDVDELIAETQLNGLLIAEDWVLANFLNIVLEAKSIERRGNEVMEVIWDAKTSNPQRFLFCLFTMMQQTIIVPERVRLTPKRTAYYRKKKIPADVTIVRLRRKTNSERHQETLVEWQHRWVVRGHWRKQVCGPNRSEHKLIWISPFVKGPEGLPFKQTKKVYVFER